KDKGNVCNSACYNEGGRDCSYGGYGQHSMLRLLVVLLVMMLIFFLGMQVGEIKGEMSVSRGYHEMRYQRMSTDDAPMMKMAPVEKSADTE
ncbi:MAG: hypothetical protein ACKOW9_02100, partial [Candidatus Paceibacterota bacterium]